MNRMEEVQAGKIVKEQTTNTSRGDNQHVEEDDGLRIVIHEKADQGSSLSSGIVEKLKSLDDVLIDEKEYLGDQQRTNKPIISRVPTKLRDNQYLKKYFEPRLVSIGPYQHGNPNVKVKEEITLKSAAMFIKQHLALDKATLCLKMKEEIEDLRNCCE